MKKKIHMAFRTQLVLILALILFALFFSFILDSGGRRDGKKLPAGTDTRR